MHCWPATHDPDVTLAIPSGVPIGFFDTDAARRAVGVLDRALARKCEQMIARGRRRTETEVRGDLRLRRRKTVGADAFLDIPQQLFLAGSQFFHGITVHSVFVDVQQPSQASHRKNLPHSTRTRH